MPMNLTSGAIIIRNAIGREPPVAWPVEAIFNFAWQTFLNHRDWRWAAGTRVTLNFVQDVARLPLPHDFGYILRITGPNLWSNPVQLVSWRRLEELRARGYGLLQGYPPVHAAVRWTAQDSGEYVPELEVWPVPNADQTAALEVSYLPASGRFPENTDDLVIGYPPFIDPIWTLWLQACTLGLVEKDIADVDTRLIPLIGGVVMAGAIKVDSGAARIHRAPPGAALEYDSRLTRRRWYT